MDVKDDTELLREYVRNRSEAAFAELVRRHIGMVYSAALRQMAGDVHAAQDMTQIVFIDLSRKSSRLTGHTSLTGWLYTSVRYAAATARRANQRRKWREREAEAMNERIPQQSSSPNWQVIQPILDEALHTLGEEDRHAILLRFLEGKTLAEVGRDLGLNENATRKRVERALQKLRHFLSRRGIAVSSVSLAETLSGKAIVDVPPALARAVTAASLTATPATFPLLKLMALTKIQVGAVAIVTAMATAILYQSQTTLRLRQEIGALRQQTARMDELRAENERMTQSQPTPSQTSGQDQARELARLRAEVTRLRGQVAAAAKAGAPRIQPAPKTEPEPDAAEQEKKLAVERMTTAKQLMLAFYNYAGDQQDRFPSDFSQIAQYFPDGATNQFEIVYQGKRTDLTNPGSTIVIQEIQSQPTSAGGWSKTYGFADGHSEVHVSNDNDFAEWERQHTQNPPSQ